MITAYQNRAGKLVAVDTAASIPADCVWIDLADPTPVEDRQVEEAFSIDVPTRAEMREIEVSNRLYQENGAYYMTAFLVRNSDAPMPEGVAITFILAGQRLVTVRYGALKSFETFRARAEKGEYGVASGLEVMLGLIENIVQRQADLVERMQDEVDRLAPPIFELKGGSQTRNRRLDVLLKGIGKQGDMVSRAQETATSVDRVLHFLLAAARTEKADTAALQRIDIAQRDITSLTEHMLFLSNRVSFLLDATLGMITTEQNQIIKLFSVMAVMLMPPTLVASIYGMNFKHMPELDWQFGYPMALGLMVLSGLIPFVYFKRKGWF